MAACTTFIRRIGVRSCLRTAVTVITIIVTVTLVLHYNHGSGTTDSTARWEDPLAKEFFSDPQLLFDSIDISDQEVQSAELKEDLTNHVFSEQNNKTLASGTSQCFMPPPTDPWANKPSRAAVQKRRTFECKKVQDDLFKLDDNQLLCLSHPFINQTKLNDCHYQCFKRGNKDQVAVFGRNITIEEKCTLIDCEMFVVRCSTANYFNYIGQIIPKSNKDGYRKPTSNYDSVLLIMLESISRSAMSRELPHTLWVLENVYGAVSFMAHNINGYNSFPNGLVFFTGRQLLTNTSIYPKNCIPDYKCDHTHFDHFPLIFKDFAKIGGHRTLYIEDLPRLGMFHYNQKGWFKPPFDHFPFSLFQQIQSGMPGSEGSSYLCHRNQIVTQIQLDLYRQMWAKYADEPKWAFGWLVEASHDAPMPMTIDDLMAEWLIKMKPMMKNTWLIIGGDHGRRYGPIRNTPEGFSEYVQAAMLVSAPLQPKYDGHRRQMQENRWKLTSHYDIYATMASLINQPSGYRGNPLFEPIPDRNCSEAGIPDEYCLCQEAGERRVPMRPRLVRRLAQILVKYLNEELQALRPKCAILTLDGYFSEAQMTVKKSHLQVLLNVSVKPSGGRFQAIMRSSSLSVQGEWQVQGRASRTNEYGNQADCIQDLMLQPYCYCPPQ